MDKESILREWFYRLPKGYAEVPYTDEEMTVLHEILNENGLNGSIFVNEIDQLDQAFLDAKPVEEDVLNEAGGQDYPSETLAFLQAQEAKLIEFYPDGITELPLAKGKYSIASLKSGKLKITDKHDIAVYSLLYPFNAQNQNIGNAEVGLWWLFATSGGTMSKNAVDGRLFSSGAPDLAIKDGGDYKAVEVKSFPSHTASTALGRWSAYKEERRVVANIFGIHALAKAFSEKTVKPLTEITFNLHTECWRLAWAMQVTINMLKWR